MDLAALRIATGVNLGNSQAVLVMLIEGVEPGARMPPRVAPATKRRDRGVEIPIAARN